MLFAIKKCFLLLFVFAVSISASASYEDLMEVASQFNKNKEKIDELEKKKRSLLKTIFKIEKETRVILRSKQKFEKKKIEIDLKISEKSKEIVGLEDNVRNLALRVQSMKIGLLFFKDSSWAEILSKSKTPSDIEEFQHILEYIGSEETETIKDYLVKIKKLNLEKIELKQMVSSALLNRKDLDQLERQVGKKHRDRKVIVAKLEKELKKAKQYYSSSKDKGMNIIKKGGYSNMKLLFSSSFHDKKGSLPWPTKGVLGQRFGLISGPLSEHIKIQSHGIEIVGSKKRNVTAVADGKIKSLSYVKGLGSVAIVAHGDNYYTVYGNISTKTLTKGQILRAGENFTNTSSQKIYFEVRHFSEPENPEDWLKEKTQENFASLESSQEREL